LRIAGVDPATYLLFFADATRNEMRAESEALAENIKQSIELLRRRL